MSDTTATLVAMASAKAAAPLSIDAVVRRASDVLIAILVLIFVAPILIVVAAIIWAQDGGPVIFAQNRIGQDGRLFRCFKLRSMRVDAAEHLAHILATDPRARAEWERDQKLRDDPRITAIGRFIRKSSLDEFPQLINVLRGEMSLVGPRPIVPAEAARYGRRFQDYMRVKPGITGLWQVSGRNHTTYSRRVALDVVFSRSNTALLYFKILIMTVPAVLLSRGSF